MNVIAQLEIELGYFDVTVHATGIPLTFTLIDVKINNRK